MVSRNTTPVPSLGLRIGQACEAGLSAGMRRKRVPPQKRKKERKKERNGISEHKFILLETNTVLIPLRIKQRNGQAYTIRG